MSWRDRAVPVNQATGGWRSRAVPVSEGNNNPSETKNPIMGIVSDAIGQNPISMASKGTDALGRAFNGLLNITSVPVSPSVQQGARSLLQPFKAAGVGVVQDLASRYSGQSPLETTQKTVAALNPSYQPSGPLETAGAYLGENAPVVAASVISPSLGGPLALMTQQAQAGRVSPLPAAIPILAGVKKAANIVGATKKVVPPLLKATKGIPTQVSKMALEDPEILNLPGTSESIQSKSQNIINAIKEANTKVGKDFGSAYAERGMKSPIESVIEKGKSPELSFEKLRQDYHSAMSGDLLNGLSDDQKLATLTELKRNLQDQAIYPAPGQQLGPSHGSYNAAIKQMASNIDELRGTIPGGENLSMADDAWKEMNQIKSTLMDAFKDPYKGQDYLNRILKGNIDWLTSGRSAGKIGAIERIEQITGKKVLQPALKEIAAAYLKNPDVVSLPSFRLQSLISSLIPNGLFFGKGAATKAGLGVIESGTSLTNEGVNKPIQNMEVISPSQPVKSILKNPKAAENKKVLDEKTALYYLDKANDNPKLARKLAEEDGWVIS